MKVFISWSGTGARDFALFLRGWIRQVVQAVQPFMSEQDIGKGARNLLEMSQELEAVQFGIVVVTRDNVAAPWINFEAGAISKSLGTGRLVPLLLDVGKPDVVGPLAQFQAVDATDHTDVERLFREINRWLEHPLDADVLLPAVQSRLPEFDDAVAAFRAGAETRGPQSALRKDRDVLDEILLLVRGLRSAPQAIEETYLPQAPVTSNWMEELRWLDENLQNGRLTPIDYRRLRDELVSQVSRGERGAQPQ
ncbi:MAG TPA: toll/interleukin-1 receptor domain-containing protein [Pseudonocardiaceae bacterium]|nr:toll/interleukin-1 receptor domain-containing protein [Pseudonocardiaceae bacterium]